MTSTVAIVDYGSGNLRSAEKALERVASEQATGQRIIVTSDADVVAKAERIVLPGVPHHDVIDLPRSMHQRADLAPGLDRRRQFHRSARLGGRRHGGDLRRQ